MAVERFLRYWTLAVLRALVSFFLVLLYFNQVWLEFSLQWAVLKSNVSCEQDIRDHVISMKCCN